MWHGVYCMYLCSQDWTKFELKKTHPNVQTWKEAYFQNISSFIVSPWESRRSHDVRIFRFVISMFHDVHQNRSLYLKKIISYLYVCIVIYFKIIQEKMILSWCVYLDLNGLIWRPKATRHKFVSGGEIMWSSKSLW